MTEFLQASLIAGQPGENGEEFVPTSSVAEVAEQVARWRLNVSVPLQSLYSFFNLISFSAYRLTEL